MNTKKCKYCGKENFNDMKFCSKCGKKFEDDMVKEEKIFCPECGAKNDVDSQYCEECGASLVEDEKDLEEEKKVDEEVNSINLEDENNAEEESVEDKIFCPECGAKNDVDNQYCEECGVSLAEDEKDLEEDKKVYEEVNSINLEDENNLEEESVEDKIFCPECGAKNDVDNQCCEECGASLVEDEKDLEEGKRDDEESNSINLEDENNAEEESVEDKIFCPECGAKNDVDNQCCEECGASLVEDEKDLEEEKKVDEEVNSINLEDENNLEEVDEEKSNDEHNSLFFEKSNRNEEKKLENDSKLLEIPKEKIRENVISIEKTKDISELEKKGNEALEENDEENENLEESTLIINDDEQDSVKTEAQVEETSLVINKNISKNNLKEANINKNEKVIKKKKTKEFKSKVKIKINPVMIGTLIVIVVAAVITTGIVINKDKIFWSAWTSELPTNINDDNYVIESKTQYSKRTKETTTNSKKELNGWTLDENNLPSDETKEEVVTETNIDSFEQNNQIQVIKKEVLEEKYVIVLCGLYNPGDGQKRFYLPNDNNPYCDQETSYTLKEVVVSDEVGSYKLGDSYKEKSYTNSDKEKIYYKVVQVINSKVKYTYKDSDSLYHFYRYSDWSKYSDEKYDSDEMTEVREVTVYRYKKK